MFSKLATFVFATFVVSAFTPVRAMTTAHVWRSANGESLPYRVHSPENPRPGWRYPLVLHLHGAGSRGTNNVDQLNVGPKQLLEWMTRSGRDCVLVAPQCPNGKQWVDTPWGGTSHRMKENPTPWLRMALELLEETLKNPLVNPARVYVMGVSMGGYGTWEVVQRRPDLVAAAIPCCGGGDVELAPRIKDVPIWAFHGSADSVVPVCRSRRMVAALWELDGNIRYREYPGCGHGSWTPTFADDSVFEWLFAQHGTPRPLPSARFSRWCGKRLAVVGDAFVATNRVAADAAWPVRFASDRSMELVLVAQDGFRDVRGRDLVILAEGHGAAESISKKKLTAVDFKAGFAEKVRTLKANNPAAEIVVISPWRVNWQPSVAAVIAAERELSAAEGVRFAEATSVTGVDPNDKAVHAALFRHKNDWVNLNADGHDVALHGLGDWLDGTVRTSDVDSRRAPGDEGLFPFVIRPDADGTAADMSRLLVAPAGRNGFLRRVGEHFVDGRGQVVRLNGINLTGRSNFPTYAEADRLAAQFARLGFNCVRLHFFDTVAYGNLFQDPAACLFRKDPSGKSTSVDEATRDRLEYLIAALKKRGLYVNCNLHVAHELGPADGVPKTGWANRGVNFFSSKLIEAEKAYAKDLLRHVNPHTGLALADDPALALVEINNENALMQVYWTKTLERQKADPFWLQEFDRRRAAAGYEATTNGINRFIVETETRYFHTMTTYLKEELGVKCPVYGTQLGYTAPWTMTGCCDLMDIHIYWTNPSLKVLPGVDRKGGRFPGTPWWVDNVPLVSSGLEGRYGNPVAIRGARRVKGFPFTVSECASPYPGWYGADFQPFIRAYGAFQDWAGVFTYSWNNEAMAFPDHNVFFFYHAARPDCVAHFPAASALFLRGDVAKARERIDVPVRAEALFDKALRAGNHDSLTDVDLENASDGAVSNGLFLRHAVSIDFNADAGAAVPRIPALADDQAFVSDTKELRWCRAKDGKGIFTVDTENVKIASGHLDETSVNLSGVSFRPGKTKLGWCTVSLLACDGKGIGKGARLLLAVTGYTHNGGGRYHYRGGENWGGTLEEFGSGKVVTEGVPLEVTLPSPVVACWALDESGARREKVSLSGTHLLSVGPQYRTVWYEICT